VNLRRVSFTLETAFAVTAAQREVRGARLLASVNFASIRRTLDGAAR